jgi:hypothetical protein
MMSLAILGLFKALSPMFPTTARRFVPTDLASALGPRLSVPVTGPSASRKAHRPLRVTRLVDQGSHAAEAGRMVMSGRFEDVCAELDRLVELESAREATRIRH